MEPPGTRTGTSPHYIKGAKAVLNNVVIVPTASPVDIKKGITAALVRNAEVESRNITVTTDNAGVVTSEGSGVTGIVDHLRISY